MEQNFDGLSKAFREVGVLNVPLAATTAAARDCTRQLGQIVASLPGAVYVDAYAALDQHPHHEMLLADGIHLSLAGHQVVADTLFPSLKKLLLESAK